jgi:hypothetical protein
VDDINRLASVDLVTEPGSTTGLFESADQSGSLTNRERAELAVLDDEVETLVDLAERGEPIRRFSFAEPEQETTGGNMTEEQKQRDGRILAIFEQMQVPRYAMTAALLADLRAAKDDGEIRKILEDRKRLVAEARGTSGSSGRGGTPSEDEGDEGLAMLRAASDSSRLSLPAEPAKERKRESWEDELAAGVTGNSDGL